MKNFNNMKTYMKFYFVTVLLLLLVLCGALAFAESPQKVKKDISPQHQTENIQRGTEQAPLFVKITAGNTNEKAGNKENSWQEQFDKNRFLFIIGFFQLAVFIWQALRLGDTINATKDSVDALKKSERPYIFVSTEVIFSDVANMEQTATCSFIVRNLGKTPSIITFADFKIMRTGETDFSLSENGQINAREVYSAGEGFKPSRCRDLPVETQNGKLFSYGKIFYKDIFGEEHLTEFHHVFVAPIEGFCVSGNTERNRYT